MRVPENEKHELYELVECNLPTSFLGMVASEYAYVVPSIIDAVNDFDLLLSTDLDVETLPSQEEIDEGIKKNNTYIKENIQMIKDIFSSPCRKHDKRVHELLDKCKEYYDHNAQELQSKISHSSMQGYKK